VQGDEGVTGKPYKGTKRCRRFPWPEEGRSGGGTQNEILAGRQRGLRIASKPQIGVRRKPEETTWSGKTAEQFARIQNLASETVEMRKN